MTSGLTITLPRLCLTPTQIQHLSALFEQQSDTEANNMAAFTVLDPYDREAFFVKWIGVLGNPDIVMRTILLGDRVLGSVLIYHRDGEPQLSYWIDKQYWGQGIATQAITLLLKEFTERPVYASAAADNGGSRAVLEKTGFVPVGTEMGFANARQCDIQEVLYALGAKPGV